MFFHQMTPFHAAAERGRCEKILGHLIAEGGDTCINIKDEDGVSYMYVKVPGTLIIGASLSKPHNSVTALWKCVCIYVWTNHLL